MPDLPRSVFILRPFLRGHRRLFAGIAKVDRGISFRTAARTAAMSLSTFITRYHCKNKNKMFKNTKLTWFEEREIVKILLTTRHPLGYITHASIREATISFVQTLPARRRQLIGFPNGGPSRTFCKSFAERHRYAVYSVPPVNEEGTEAPFISATEIVKHFVDLTAMVKEDKLQDYNIWCLTCKTVGVDIGMNEGSIKFLTVLTILNASGKSVSQHHIAHNGDAEEAVMSSPNFRDWLSHVSRKMRNTPVQDQVSPHPYQLLLCDESLLFINAEARDFLFLRDIIVYSIPGLGNGFPGSHDVGCTELWAQKFQEFFEMECRETWVPKTMWTEGTLLMFIQSASDAVLTEDKIKKSFANAGICPLDEVRFYKHPRPLSFEDKDVICDMEKMCIMVDNAIKKD